MYAHASFWLEASFHQYVTNEKNRLRPDIFAILFLDFKWPTRFYARHLSRFKHYVIGTRGTQVEAGHIAKKICAARHILSRKTRMGMAWRN